MLPFIRSDLAQFTGYAPHAEGEAQPEQFDQLDTNECPYDLPKELKDKLAWQIQQQIQSNRYPDGGHGELRGAIAAYVTETAQASETSSPSPTPFTADQITVGNGSDELIRSLIIATCLGGEGAVLVANPTFSMYRIIAQTLGVPVVQVGRNDETFEVDLEAAQAAIAQAATSPVGPPVRLVFMVHPNSPTANTLTEAELAWLSGLPDSTLVVIDEAYYEFSRQTLVADVLTRPNWVITRTFSKAFRLAAHRVGYGVAHPDVIRILEQLRLPYNLPSLTQTAAQVALAHRGELLAVVDEIVGERDRLQAALRQLPQLQCFATEANFIYAQLQPGLVTETDRALDQVRRQLKAQGTILRHTGNGLRITIGSPTENQRTLTRLTQALANLTP